MKGWSGKEDNTATVLAYKISYGTTLSSQTIFQPDFIDGSIAWIGDDAVMGVWL
jgi:hypothetical protein